MKCKHRINKGICIASWATPYDEIYECKTKRGECPCYEEGKFDSDQLTYDLTYDHPMEWDLFGTHSEIREIIYWQSRVGSQQ